MVQCMMTAGFFFGTNASRNTAPCNVLLTKRPSLLGGSNRRRDQSRHSESEKQSETIGFNFWRGIGPASFFSSVICDRACEMIPVQKHQSLLRLSFFSFVGDSFSPSAHAADRPSCAPAWRHGQGQALRVLRNLDPAGRGRNAAAWAPREMSLVPPREMTQGVTHSRLLNRLQCTQAPYRMRCAPAS